MKPAAEQAVPAKQSLLARLPRPTGAQGAAVAVAVMSAGLALGMAQASRPDARPAPGETRRAAAARPLAVTPVADTAEPTVLRLQDLTPDQARAWNAANPISTSPNPAARPFHLATEGLLDEARAADCLTAAVYYEAAYESLDGQRAVAQVVLNRLRHPAYPKTICGVVFQGSERTTGCQFTFTCDGSLSRTPNAEVWERARKVALAALNGYVMKKVGNATHYHAVYVAPYWSPNLVKVAGIGAHVFYRWTGGWGRPPAFSGAYAGSEVDSFRIAALDRLAVTSTVALPETGDKPLAAEAPPVVEVSAETTAVEPKGLEIVSAADAAKDASGLVAADDLDWAGRPKDRGPARTATGF